MKRLVLYIRYFIDFIHSKLNPIGYIKSIGVNLGENVHFYGIKPSTFSTEPWLITIGNNVYITNGCQFITHDGGTLILRKEVPDLELTAPIKIGNDVYIGLNVTIMPGVSIGNRCIIGTGSIVTKDIPSNSVAAGIPAKVIKSVDDYLDKAKENSLHCGHLSAKEKEKKLKEIFKIV